MHRLLALVLVLGCIAVGVALPTRTAHACECAEPPAAGMPPYDQVAGAHGAVVGQVRDIRPGPGETAIARVAVDTAVHVELDPLVDLPIDVHTSCEISVSEGQGVGFLLPEDVGEWGLGMCSRLPIDDLLAATELPEPNATGPPAYVATGPLGHAAVAYLDADGGLLGYGGWEEPMPRPLAAGKRTPDVRVADVCAGGPTVEYVGDIAWAGQRPAPSLVVRDPVTGGATWSFSYAELLDDDPRSGPNVFQGATCTAADGSEVIAVLGYYDPPDVGRRRVVRLTPDGITTIADGAFHEVLPVGERDVVRLGDGSRMGWLDLATGEVTEVADLLPDTQSMHLSATGDSVWVTTGPDDRDWETRPTDPLHLARVDLSAEDITAEVAVPGTEGQHRLVVLPLSDGGVLVSAGLHHDVARYLRYDAALAPPTEWTGPAMFDLAERDGTIAGVDSVHAMWVAPPGEQRFLPHGDGVDLPLAAVHALPEGLGAMTPRTTPGAALFRPEQGTDQAEETTDQGDDPGDESEGPAETVTQRDVPEAPAPQGPWQWVVAVAVLLTLGLVVLRARR